MKIKNPRPAAFLNLRVLAAFLLFLTAGMLTLFAFAGAQQPDNNIQTLHSSHWLVRLASTLGIMSQSQPGGAIKLDKYPADPAKALQPAAVPYTGAPQILRPVAAVRSGMLRFTPPIEPKSVAKIAHPEPKRPTPPTKSGGPEGPMQTQGGAVVSAPSPTGLSFDGVGVGLAGFIVGSNPPDVNGRVGATQYVQWNNTSFAVFDKTTGALQYGPAAGNTLFQSLGGACAAHNDGDPVVSYDILAGRWVISQFAVAVSDTDYSHQCIAVSTTSDATGDYYLYDFVTDPVNFVDYPHTAVWPDGYYMSTHVFGAGLVFTTARVYVFERERMIYGLPARMQSVDLDQQYGLLPADLDSLTPPPVGEAEFVLAPGVLLFNTTETTRIQVTWDAAPTIVALKGAPIMAGVG